jgi:ComF family protein
MVRWVNAAMQCVVDFLVDERCHVCGASSAAMDEAARAPARPLATPVDVLALGSLRLRTRPLCPSCALRVNAWPEPLLLGPAGEGGGLPAFPAFVSDERFLVLIHLMKFGRRERLAPWLARAMAGGLPRQAVESLEAPPILVPVPMDRGARARRGFNQAERIAVELGRCWNVPVAPSALVKRRPTRPQSSLGRRERLANLAGAFGRGRDDVADRDVILVDDVVTTGATALACAATLRSARARTVRVVCAGYRPESAGAPKTGVSSILTTTSITR